MKSQAAMEVIAYLKENLRVEVDKEHGDFYDHDSRIRVAIFLSDEEISSSSCSIKESE